MIVYLIGAGMGNPDLLTAQARRAIDSSGLLLGAQRLLDAISSDCPKRALVRASEIAEAIHESHVQQISVLFSGDAGFFSGAQRLMPLLKDCEVSILPGISSLSYFCARCQRPWQEVYPLSCHGRDGGIVPAVQSHTATFVLTGGAFRVQTLCRELERAGLGTLRAWAGEHLSYPDERIASSSVSELAEEDFSDLAVLLVENPSPLRPLYQAPGLPDDAFQRGKTPMTKEEVRALAIAKLRLRARDVVWDVGAGTGSVAVECALLLPEGTVWAVERSASAAELIVRNQTRFHLSNCHLVCGEAPECLRALPAPDRVFIGGSGGRLQEMIVAALKKNPSVRIVLSAITLETLSAALQAARAYQFQTVDIVQVCVAKAHTVEEYHMLRANNPVYLISLEDARCCPA